MTARFAKHVAVSDAFKDQLEKRGLKLVPVSRALAAHTLTAIYYPEGITAADLLPKIAARGVVVAGGLMPGLGGTYFRVGHMGYSATEGEKGHVEETAGAIWAALGECGFKG
jgi:alanine-glyoxylate transaminase/serine-glyoxylate transaminase/serine-pyruvate transaminase